MGSIFDLVGYATVVYEPLHVAEIETTAVWTGYSDRLDLSGEDSIPYYLALLVFSETDVAS